MAAVPATFGAPTVSGDSSPGIFTTLLVYGYYVYLEMTKGQTVGKMALSFKVDRPRWRAAHAGRRPCAATPRLLLGIVPILGGLAQFVIVIVIAVTISNDPFNRGWHDNFAGGTAVVRAK